MFYLEQGKLGRLIFLSLYQYLFISRSITTPVKFMGSLSLGSTLFRKESKNILNVRGDVLYKESSLAVL